MAISPRQFSKTVSLVLSIKCVDSGRFRLTSNRYLRKNGVAGPLLANDWIAMADMIVLPFVALQCVAISQRKAAWGRWSTW
jgi:hypothetical protein